MIPHLQSGSGAVRRTVNALVHAVNGLMRIRGDRYIEVTRGPAGIGLHLNVPHVMEHAVRVGQSVTHAGYQPRLAYCSEDAPTGNTIDCRLDSTRGEALSVTCSIVGGNNLSDAFPLLTDGTLLPIMYNPTTGAAVAMTVFQTFTNCVCDTGA